MRLSPQTRFPVFITRGGQLLIRKLYEYRIVNGKVVVIDLPEPGHQPEYLSVEQSRLWNEKQRKILESAAKQN